MDIHKQTNFCGWITRTFSKKCPNMLWVMLGGTNIIMHGRIRCSTRQTLMLRLEGMLTRSEWDRWRLMDPFYMCLAALNAC
jgi:hypothetical protein